MDDILDIVMCSTEDDDARFAALIKQAIREGKAASFDAFTTVYGSADSGDMEEDDTARAPSKKGAKGAAKAPAKESDALKKAREARKRRAEGEAAEAAAMMEEEREKALGRGGKAAGKVAAAAKGSMDELTALILAKQERRGGAGIFDDLVKKYGGDSSGVASAGKKRKGKAITEDDAPSKRSPRKK
jgi:hypothetical protein